MKTKYPCAFGLALSFASYFFLWMFAPAPQAAGTASGEGSRVVPRSIARAEKPSRLAKDCRRLADLFEYQVNARAGLPWTTARMLHVGSECP